MVLSRAVKVLQAFPLTEQKNKLGKRIFKRGHLKGQCHILSVNCLNVFVNASPAGSWVSSGCMSRSNY